MPSKAADAVPSGRGDTKERIVHVPDNVSWSPTSHVSPTIDAELPHTSMGFPVTSLHAQGGKMDVKYNVAEM